MTTADVVTAPSTIPSLLDALRGPDAVIAAELRPPLAELAGPEGMNAWIDTYHAVRRLSKSGTYVFLTDSAVGTAEEDNLRHLIANLGTDVPRERIVPFLTCKHPLGYCGRSSDRMKNHWRWAAGRTRTRMRPGRFGICSSPASRRSST